MTPALRIRKSLRNAEKVLGIPTIFDEEDIEAILSGNPNKCLELYLSLFSTACRVSKQNLATLKK